ncbi:MAG TPA: hypothetical protein PKE26_17045 [Kiritimatiellia bacterium]|nr:hypothetical protein [Saprospiraceae bacterium]HMP00806.1 hypothetical protein [Kiritimatiellia bacterium]
MRTIVQIIGLSLLINAALAIPCSINFMVNAVVIAIALFIGVPLLLLASGALSVTSRHATANTPSWPIRCFIAGILVVSTLLAPYLGGLIVDYRIRNAQNASIAVIKQLDQWKSERGQYPAVLSDLMVDQSQLPSLLRQSRAYSSNGTNFWITLSRPNAFIDVHTFSSIDRKWRKED